MPRRNKRVKKCKDDRLSNLPDDILHKILSFTDTKFAVQTCLLSKRIFCFKRFILDVLTRRDQSVDIAFKWTGENFVFPQRLIACESINSLVMETFRPGILPGNWFGFVGLQDLHLSRMQFHYESQQPFDPFSSCPNLRSLYLGIELLAPVLTSFSFTNSIPQSFALVELPAFVTLSYGTIEILVKAPSRLQHQTSPFVELEKMKLKMQHGENSIAIPPYVIAYLLSASGFRTTLEVEVERIKVKTFVSNPDLVEIPSFPTLALALDF
ncbi:hypothetical protein Patl1_03444 [Pistacia atlantica]|uniref:Uncharacterized protein n=1 Tax=Pistacia atlantica TaxID=434234 RepID=A0ACC1CDC2_9ROSI|nr:hypothetical protein Patl1_03444 [Pistacia atlantica]